MQLIQELVIPKYIIKVKLSNKTRPKYYRKKKNGKWYPRKLSKKRREKLRNGVYSMKGKYIVDEKGEKILANTKSVGKPNYEKLNGNSFSSGFGSPHIRNTLVGALKDFYRPYTDTMEQITEFPLWIDWHLYTTIPPRLFDLTNFWFYWKYFEDSLTETTDAQGNSKDSIIPDDNITYITKPGTSPILHPIENWEDRKFVFKIYKDNRPCLKNHPLYQ